MGKAYHASGIRAKHGKYNGDSASVYGNRNIEIDIRRKLINNNEVMAILMVMVMVMGMGRGMEMEMAILMVMEWQ